MMVFRSILFWILLSLLSLVAALLFLPVLLLPTSIGADIVGKNWVRALLFLLKYVGGIDHKIIGKDNLPKSPFIIACKHQSMWETTIMATIFSRPAPVFKKELAYVPIFGWFLLKSSSIKVDRKGGTKALKSTIKQAQHYLKNKQNIVIFPQGTRVPITASSKDYKYQSGVAALYLNCDVPVVPVALNSGLFWNKQNKLLKKGTITLKFLNPIPPGLDKKQFMTKLENIIESESDRLV